jgi:MYXO-CTERM domain-containing protein
MLSLLGCEGAGNAPPSEQSATGTRTELSSHKVQLSAKQAQELLQRGANVEEIADYGAFKLVQVDEKALASLPEGAEVRDEYNDILLNAGTIDTMSAHGQSLRGMRQAAAAGKRFYLVQFAGPIQPEWYKGLEQTGVQVVSYIPNNAYLVYGDATTLRSLHGLIGNKAGRIQWDGEYLNDYKLNASIHTSSSETFEVQLIKDGEANQETLALIQGLQSRSGTIQEALGYVNVHTYLTVQDLHQIATRPDVLSIQPRPMPRKYDERQNMIVSGQLTGTQPNPPNWLQWLTEKGFTQAQFTASGFGVDVTDSGVDNATPSSPNHFGLYVGGNVNNASRLVYSRLEGTPHSGSTIQGCDGHGNLNTHIIGGYASQTGTPFEDEQGFNFGMGVAPFVKFGSSVIFDPGTFTSPDYEDLQSRAYRDGMRISSNSWGANTSAYTADAQRYDALVRDAQPADSAVAAPGNQEMVIVFAAGNSGSGAGTVGSPGTAKNLITAGASENVQPFGGADQCGTTDAEANSAMDIVAFSSRGPTGDGRKKPELMAPGTHVSGGVAQAVRSTNPPTGLGGALSCFDATGVCAGPGSSNFFPVGQQWYTASSGTSHSTPAIAGGAALVRQYFINQGMAPPSAAMTKAYLMNSARYMTGTGANDNLWSNNQGMGLMDLGMAFDEVPRTLDDQNPSNLFTATGQTRTFEGTWGDASKPFRVTLAWTDAPGSTTGSAWKNNLDLSVTVGGNTYKGNVFTGASSVTGGTADAANNVESVFLPAGSSGPFTVTVTATNINSDGVPGNSTTLDQDFALVAYNTCGTTPAPTTGVTATASEANAVSISWTANDASSYNIYRATTPGGPYTKVGSAAAPPFRDAGLSGGTTYYYVVRGKLCVEAPASTEVAVTATGACTLPPTFAGVTNVANAGTATCGTTVSWAAATPVCGGTLSYSVYRGTTPGFTPSLGNKIASGISGSSFADDLNLTNGTRYYYVVRATETSNASNEDTNTVEKSAMPTGAVTPGVRYFDDLDGNRPPNASSYWIPTATTGSATTLNIVTGCRYQSADKSYRFGPTTGGCTGTYPISTLATLVLGGNGSAAGINGFTLPADTRSPQLTFNLSYTMETRYDGAWLVYSTTSATGPWTNVGDAVSATAPYISAGGYDNTLNSSTTTRIWTGANAGTNGALKAVTVNLSALAGQKVWFGFRFSSDNLVNQEGAYLDDVRLTADSYATCTTNTPPPGPAASFRVTGLPASVQADTAATFNVAAYDALGQPATSYSGTASFTSSDAQAQLPSPVSFTGGVASNVSITFRTVGTQSVIAKDTANLAITGSGSTSVTAGAATALVFSVQPADAAAGASISPAVKVGLVDRFGNTVTTGSNSVTLALGSNPSGGTLSGTTTATMTGGVATFSNLSLNKVGVGYTLTATSTGLTDATSSAFKIVAGPPAKLAILTQPGNSSAGAAISPAVRVALLDGQDNPTTSTGAVSIALAANTAGGTLSGTTTVAAVNGVATFSTLAITKVGTGYTLSASAPSLTAVTTDAFNITPAAPYRVTITQQPSDAVAGAAITPAVQATVYDRYANVATQATTAVSLSIGNNPSGGALSGNTTVTVVDGVATFNNVSVDRTGSSYTLVAGASGLYTDTSVGFNVLAGAASQLAFTASPSGFVGSGSPFTVRVAVRDAAGNLLTNASTQVTLSLTNAPGATLSGTTTATTANGVATFAGLSVDKAGFGYTLQASASGLTPATSPSFSVAPGAASALAFVTQPGNGSAGAAFAPAVSVAVLDAQGNTVASSGTAITLALSAHPSGGTLSGTKTVATANGVATFSDLSIARAATGYQLTAQANGLANASSAMFNITSGPKAAVAFTVQPGSTRVGAAITPAVRVSIQDAHGNVVTNATDAVTVALGNNPRNGTLSGTQTVNAINGVATFSDLSINRNGKGYTLQASAGALSSAASRSFDITPGSSPKLVFRTTTAQTAAGTALPSIEVELRDELDVLDTDNTATVTLSLGENTAGAQLLGPLTAKAVNGVAKFDGVTLRKTGTGYTLVATAQEFAGTTSTPFNVTPGATASFALSVAPSVGAGQEASLSALAYDAYGNQAANYGGTVKVTSSDASATFVTNATFVEGALNGFKVTFKSPGLRTVTITDTEKASLSSTAQLNITAFAQPTVSVTNPEGGATVSGMVSISATGAVAPGTTLTQISILVDGVVIATGTEATLTGTWDSSQVEGESSHTITAVVIDGAGNVANSAPVTIVAAAGGCGCGATSGTDASIYLGLLILARYVLGRRRQADAA